MAHQAWDLHLSKSKASTFGTWDRTAGNVAGWEILYKWKFLWETGEFHLPRLSTGGQTSTWLDKFWLFWDTYTY